MPAKQNAGKVRSKAKPSKTPKAAASMATAEDRSALAKRPVSAQGGPKPRVRASKRPTDDQIRVRAYEIYLARGQVPGDPDEDWQAAAKELRA